MIINHVEVVITEDSLMPPIKKLSIFYLVPIFYRFTVSSMENVFFPESKILL